MHNSPHLASESAVFRPLGFSLCLTWAITSILLVLFPPNLLAKNEARESPSTYQQAQPGYTFQFPHDHGAHERFLTEWWYFTGHLFTADKRRFGYELTFFRRAVDDDRVHTHPSQWAIRQLYLAHFALTDEQRQDFRFAEKISRAGVGKAGAKEGLLHTWIDRWFVKATDNEHKTFHLHAQAKDFAVDLFTTALKPPVIHGRGGISQKGARSTHASHYYSLPRLQTRGTLHVQEQEYSVTGTSWMDQEFASSDLEDGLVGWDWFSIQLDSGHDIMTYWLRQEDGTFSSASSGTLIFPDGSSRHLTRKDLKLTILDHWNSPQSGAHYPSEWTLSLHSPPIQLHIKPLTANQELQTTKSTQVTYWEGAVDVSGTFEQTPASGMGYVELTGYAEPYKPGS
ncbi:MAG: carotenoid 1,2-hydratase [Nitrospirales bacterium]|nr:carotenoid 1,2-hydratase [Nitrospira sp.]MDR4500973.1 carotenoid 1,2-hydratase [Nitrospirales bacterium]